MKRYQKSLFQRVPLVKRRSVFARVPLVKRKSIFRREPICKEYIHVDGCCIGSTDCSGKTYCDPSTFAEVDKESFRLIRVTQQLDNSGWNEIFRLLNFVQSQGCYVRMVTDVHVPKEVLFELAYSPFNVIQFNLNTFSSDNELSAIKGSIFTADNCGLYVAIMLYPIMPEVTKTYDLLEFLSSMRCSCNNVCFKFIEFDRTHNPVMGYFNINGHLIPEKYMELVGDKYICNSYFKESFCTIITSYLSPRKISCSLCNDNICY